MADRSTHLLALSAPVIEQVIASGSLQSTMLLRLTCSELAKRCRASAAGLWERNYGSVCEEYTDEECWTAVRQRHSHQSGTFIDLDDPDRLKPRVSQVAAAIDLLTSPIAASTYDLEVDTDKVVHDAIQPLVLAAAERNREADTTFFDMCGEQWVAENLVLTAKLDDKPITEAQVKVLKQDLVQHCVVSTEQDAAELCDAMAQAIEQAFAPELWAANAYNELERLLDGLYYTSESEFVLWRPGHLQVLTGKIVGDEHRWFEPFVHFVGGYWHDHTNTTHKCIFECSSHTCECMPDRYAKEYLRIDHLTDEQVHTFLVLVSVRFDIEAFCRVMCMLYHQQGEVHVSSDVLSELQSRVRRFM